MDPRRRKELEIFLKSHRKRYKNLEALDILNLESSCNNYMSKNHPNISSDIETLKTSTQYVKTGIDIYTLADQYSNNYACISTYNDIVKELPIQFTWLSKKSNMDQRQRFSYLDNSKTEMLRCRMLIKLMTKKLNCLARESLLPTYMDRYIQNPRNHVWKLERYEHTLLESQLRKFIKVMELSRPLCSSIETHNKGWNQYKTLAELLIFCCNLKIEDSTIIIKLVSIIMNIKNCCRKDNEDQPTYSDTFFEYITKHISKMGAHYVLFSQDLSKNAWSYCTNFSIIDSVSCGDEKRLKYLISNGFKVLSDNELFRGPQLIPLQQQIILEIIRAILSKEPTINNRDVILTDQQKKCFLIVLQEFTDCFITCKDLEDSLTKDYNYMLSCNTSESEDTCIGRLVENITLCEIYANNFQDLAYGSKPENAFRTFLYSPYDFKKNAKVKLFAYR